MANIAVVTGGGSGIGLSTSNLLISHGWHVVILDRDSGGQKVAELINATFIQTDVSDYESVARAFASVWSTFGRLNFVFANAGVLEKDSFYASQPEDQNGIPPPISTGPVDVNLCGVINTTYLALHFMRKSEGPKSLIMTCSTGELYPVRAAPLYAAAKHGVLGLTRSLAEGLWSNDNIRVNCICPGTTVTGIMKSQGWSLFPKSVVTKPFQVAKVVISILENDNLHGSAVEIVQDSVYYREVPPFMDERIEQLTLLTDNIVG